MKEIEIIKKGFMSNDGVVFENESECICHELKKSIENGEQIILKDFLKNNPSIKKITCYTNTFVDIMHGINKGKVEKKFYRINSINNNEKWKNYASYETFGNKKITYVDFYEDDIAFYVDFSLKDWNKELQNLGFKNPKIVNIENFEFDDF